MPSMCVAYGCYNKGGHRFPKDISRQQKWVAAVNRANFTPTEESRVCHKHFLPTDYSTEGFVSGLPLKNRVLKKSAVPSIFNFNKQSPSPTKRHGTRSKESQAKRKILQGKCSSPKAAYYSGQPDNHIPTNNIHNTTYPAPIDVCFGMCCEYEVTSDTIDDCPVSSCKKPVQCRVIPKSNRKDTSPSVVSVSTQTIYRSPFCFEKLKNDPGCIMYYTGLESFEKLKVVLQSLGPAAYELNYRYTDFESITVEDQFLMTLVKLRRATPDFELAFLFDVSRETVQTVLVTWLNFMYHEWSGLDIWPDKDLVTYYMPQQFKRMYPNTRAILNSIEFPIELPHTIFEHATFSTYSNRRTLKSLVGTTPGGLVSFCSPSYGGSVSDRTIAERGDLMQKCDPGDSIMANQGFTLHDIFLSSQVTVNMPATLKSAALLPGVTVLADRKLASKRINIERLNRLTKTYRILKCELPVHYVPLGSEILFVCCILCNFLENTVV